MFFYVCYILLTKIIINLSLWNQRYAIVIVKSCHYCKISLINKEHCDIFYFRHSDHNYKKARYGYRFKYGVNTLNVHETTILHLKQKAWVSNPHCGKLIPCIIYILSPSEKSKGARLVPASLQEVSLHGKPIIKLSERFFYQQVLPC